MVNGILSSKWYFILAASLVLLISRGVFADTVPACYWCLSEYGTWQPAPSAPEATSDKLGWTRLDSFSSYPPADDRGHPVIQAKNVAARHFPYYYGGVSEDNYLATRQNRPDRVQNFLIAGKMFNHWFSDVADDAKSESFNTKHACLNLIEHYGEKPLETNAELEKFINRTFYSTPALRKEFGRGILPSTFHCCHQTLEQQNYFAENHRQSELSETHHRPRSRKQQHIRFNTPVLPANVTCKQLVDSLLAELIQNVAAKKTKTRRSDKVNSN